MTFNRTLAQWFWGWQTNGHSVGILHLLWFYLLDIQLLSSILQLTPSQIRIRSAQMYRKYLKDFSKKAAEISKIKDLSKLIETELLFD